MARNVKHRSPRRRYDASGRRAAAEENRRAIADVARRLFLEFGYSATTMAAIAKAAGVSHETVYATIGPKPVVFRHLVETALSGTDEPIPPLERDYARQVMAERNPGRLIDIYASAMRGTQERLAPLFDVLMHGAKTSPELESYHRELIKRRAHYTRLIAEHLAEIGGLREDVPTGVAADVLFGLNSSEFFLLFVRDRGWEPEFFEGWLAAAWKSLLLPDHGAPIAGGVPG
jgi:AcrR family transcriptional regulator